MGNNGWFFPFDGAAYCGLHERYEVYARTWHLPRWILPTHLITLTLTYLIHVNTLAYDNIRVNTMTMRCTIVNNIICKLIWACSETSNPLFLVGMVRYHKPDVLTLWSSKTSDCWRGDAVVEFRDFCWRSWPSLGERYRIHINGIGIPRWPWWRSFPANVWIICCDRLRCYCAVGWQLVYLGAILNNFGGCGLGGQ